MKLLFVLIFLVINPITDLDKIARINKAKKEAKEAFLSKNYQLAHDKYQFLIDSLGVKEEEVLLDYAHTMYNLNDTTNAVNKYVELSESSNKIIGSVAEQQLGQVMFDKKQYEPALEHYKNALRKNPSNQDARYNYELLKKIIRKQEEDNKDQQNQDQDKKDQEKQDKNKEKKDQEKKDQEQQDKQNQDEQEKNDQEKKDQEKKDGEQDEDQEKKKEEQKDKEQQDGEKSDDKKKEEPTPSPSNKLKEMNISEEKAKMILEAMKNNEIQYIQQNRRKATKKKDSTKPDW